MKKFVFIALAAALALGTSTSCVKEKEVYYSVTFDSQGGSAVGSLRALEGHKIERPADPTRDGYTFVDWFKEAEATNAWNFSTDVVREKLTLYAGWDASSGETIGEELAALISDAEEITEETDYSAGSWDAFQTALDAAKAAAEDPEATTEELQTALDNLEAAMDALVDISALNDAIATADELDNEGGDYTTESWDIFAAALAEAKTVAADPDATAEEVEAALEALQTAEEGLVPATNKGVLEQLIGDAEELVEEDYTPASWTLFEAAIAAAQEVLDDPEATEQDYLDAIEALQDAIDEGLVERADNSALVTLIETAEGELEGDYTSASLSALQDAIDAAQAVADDGDATDAEIAQAVLDLQAAIDALVEIADTTDLDAAVEEAEALTETDYTVDSYAAVTAALDTIDGLTEESTQGEVESALAALEAAMDALVDISDLKDAVDAANMLNNDNGDYTTDSWTAFDGKLTDAETALANDAILQPAVNTALEDLETAQEALVVLTDLNTAVDYVGTLTEGDYTAATWGDVDSALTAAEGVQGTAAATQEAVDNAYDALVAAIGDLEYEPGPGSANKTDLATAIGAVSGLTEGDYTSASWTVFEDALNMAESLNDNAQATQDEVDAAVIILDRAHRQLVHAATDTAASLDALVAQGQTYVEEDYTSASWTPFDAALTAADDLDTSTASASEIQTAYQALQAAIQGLSPAQSPDGLVSSLLDELSGAIDGLPTVEKIQSNPLSFAVAMILAPTVDVLRDTLMELLGNDDSGNNELIALNTRLDDILTALGLGSLI
ncbi:MAG: InlB B-repeat-containing protein [Alistipes sp.]|nr:InlB B-repeat-containing protein [Alistipes sp.]